MKTLLLDPPLVTPQVFWLASIGQVRLGTNLHSEWCIGVGEWNTVLSKPEDMMPLLPLLEMDRLKFYGHLYKVAQDHAELAGIVQSFPEALLLRFSFESSVSDYWPMKAIDWIKATGKVTPDVRESLSAMLNKSWVPQRLRQRVEMLVKHSE
ncbi:MULTISPECIES: hypothetical protein [Ralstonia solanacearum species complex]|uniref:Putative aldehyde dehydrogenase protein n=2 Tax=Ralstonia solanacearum species complex TaxID=3116862 RepID=A0A0S4UGC3_RALSL|nr:hypothetical protein [Ralstonia pseudosolanacearum]QIK26177.1 hypothetical protein G7939_22640 [Ralstonia solanacearum]AST85176.1 hypothetical protein CIG66_01195 [Ralstonia pseudosolanacearum]MCK4125838.1 hypothetical protein [Ralstonia pseudosolanacearum]MDO3509621.1 hypothetical protein [Ralstonia pseudosolanacearum]MDO3511927.1 hypothetical protein [Ralstonia pseudosolanacearum]